MTVSDSSTDDAAASERVPDKTLLIVDDDAPLLRRLSVAMERRGFGNSVRQILFECSLAIVVEFAMRCSVQTASSS